MDYGQLGERRRGFQLPVLEIVSALLLLVAIVLTMLELVAYSDTRDSLPTDLTVAGIAVGGLSEADARARWESVYLKQPIQLSYEGSPIVLYPEEIGFRVASDVMLAEARAQSAQAQSFWAGFWNYLERRPVAAVSVGLIAEYPEGALREYLEGIAERYDARPGGAEYNLDTLTFSAGRSGKRLDIDAAIPLIHRALFEPEAANRRVALPTEDLRAGDRDISSLRRAIIDLMTRMGFAYNGAQTMASVYVMDLATGEDVAILADVPHSARSVIKIPIMINLFREKLLVSQEEAYLLAESILCSNNSASNYLMQLAGQGESFEPQLRDGLNQASCTAQEAGAVHTYISAPLYVADRAYQFEAAVCRPTVPANTAYNTNPDPYAQTTAQDIGFLLTQIYDCARHNSGLRAIYPDDITQTECEQMLELLSGNRIDRLLELGLPPGTRIAHKNGWGIETSADGGIVFSPGGDYVIVVFTWEEDLDGNNLPTLLSWEVIEEISRLTYNYFNPNTPLLTRREPLNPYGAIDCVSFMSTEDVNLNNINENRLDENGIPLPTACYGGAGHCKPFDNWGRGE
ncbi:MAG: serine hydrolase [Chloroflexota bacterium]